MTRQKTNRRAHSGNNVTCSRSCFSLCLVLWPEMSHMSENSSLGNQKKKRERKKKKQGGKAIWGCGSFNVDFLNLTDIQWDSRVERWFHFLSSNFVLQHYDKDCASLCITVWHSAWFSNILPCARFFVRSALYAAILLNYCFWINTYILHL